MNMKTKSLGFAICAAAVTLLSLAVLSAQTDTRAETVTDLQIREIQEADISPEEMNEIADLDPSRVMELTEELGTATPNEYACAFVGEDPELARLVLEIIN